MKYTFFVIKQFSSWRWIVTIILIIGSFYDIYSMQSSFYELFLVSTNDPAPLSLYLILLLLIADFGYTRKDPNMHNRKIIGIQRIHNYFFCAAAICLIFLSLLIAGDILTQLLNGGLNFNNKWLSIQQPQGVDWLTPISATFISTLLFYLRLIFITMLVFLINKLSVKVPFGYLGGFAILLIDAIGFYNLQDIPKPSWIFPFGYLRLESVLNHTKEPLLDINIGIAYWLALLAIIGLIFVLIEAIDKKKRKQEIIP